VKSPDIKRFAFELYLEGLGFRNIGRILKISYGTVYVWIREWRSKMPVPRRENPMEAVAPEKLIAHIESRKEANGSGLLLIDLEKNVSFFSMDSGSGPKK
jgi:transposase